ncbi:related to TRS130-subunit of the TRAPP complex of the cis-Golgi [Sporisorium reilianum f. sp. reilianum]|uniref:Related to TRS130-subunit of the TRAPP complex of the cis-Golgi n=1 Tax=Sporisorium reilianum f. sp. reilianum TaxID=72559 RepID=A0A2N8UM87_9BASI|nr:related to TRS130-subunit of the TRAPP complex of the cis-Golgi [Sporisorium reilianum f. sp. reilianum]
MTDHRNAAAETITVTYAASQALLAAPLTPHFVHLLKEQLPLRNLHWRPSQATLDAEAARATQQGKSTYASSSVVPGSTIRTIQTLDVSLKPLTDEIRRWRGDPGYFEQSATPGLLDRPFVHLYLVVCEDSEHYRTTVRNEIRSWISSLSFFHAKQAAPASHAPSSIGTPTLASSSRTSLALGSFRSATPLVRSDTPPTTATGSGPNTPTNQGVPSKSVVSTSGSATGPTEPEYLIVLITPPEGAGISGLAGPGAASADQKSGMSRFMTKSKGNVLEKARADFNTSKKEHVVQLSRLPPVPAVPLGRSGLHSMDPTIWAELLTKMREAASSTFTTTIEAQEHEIARCGVTRGQQGWDFCSYFLAKDSLARTLEAVGLKDDAVGQYEDLEIVFAQAMQSGAVAFAPVGGDDPNDDSLPLLDVTKKPYADLIRRREISLFDFRCYLFARKSALLGKMGRVAAVMREAPLFISAVGRMLRRNKRLSSQWIESWIFSAALDVVEQCQAWLIQRGGQSLTSTDDQLSPAFHSNKSELLDVARRQLDRIGIEAGHLPPSEPFAFDATMALKERDLPPLPESTADTTVEGLGAAVVLDQKRGSSRPELQQAVMSREHFDSHYIALCERIRTGWTAASRTRDALHIRTIVATLHYLRAKHQLAYDGLLVLAEAYASAKFTALEQHALAMQLECHAKLNKPKDRAWIAAALAALKVSVQSPSSNSSVDADAARWTEPVHLCEQLRVVSSALGKEIPVSGFPLFSIAVSQSCAKLAETEDGSLLRVDITSLLPCEQVVEDVRVCLVTGGSETLWYTSSKIELAPGTTSVELFCPHPVHGVYTVDVTQIRMARLIFQYEHGSAAAGAQPVIVRVPKDGAAPSVVAGLPHQIDLDQPRAIEVTVRAGRNDIDLAEFSVSSVDGAALVDCSAAKLSSDAKTDAATRIEQGSAASVTLKQLKKGGEAVVVLPLSQLPESGLLDAIILLSYTTTSSSPSVPQRHPTGKKRTLKVRVQLKTALPLGVNVQDFFRTSCLLSKFTISAGGGGSIRLQPVSMVHDNAEHAQAYTIASYASQREATVTPRQPATYVFRLSRTDAASRADTRLRLVVQYRALQEDAVSAAVRALDAVVQQREVQGLESGAAGRRLVQEALVAYVRERLDLPAFSITGQAKTGGLDRGWWRTERRAWGQGALELDALLEVVQAALDAIVSGVVGAEEDEVWQKLTIPVDVPSIDYVNAVTLSLPTTTAIDTEPASLIVGQPVELTVRIHTSTLWSSSPHHEAMVYDIAPDFDTWLVDGTKRGSFAFQPDAATHTFTVTLVPLRTGTVALPSVHVRPLSTVSGAGERGGKATCETYTTNAAQRVTVVPARSVQAFFVPAARLGERESWKSAAAWHAQSLHAG